MKTFQSIVKIGNHDNTYDLYFGKMLWYSDLTEEELNNFLDPLEKSADLSIRLVETRETDNGTDYMWNLIVDGLPMYVGIPWEFADAIINALLYRREEKRK